MPPWRAIAIAIRASVTVSIAAESSGTATRDLAGQPRGGVDLGRDDVGLARQQQHVVEGQAERGERGCRCRLRGGRHHVGRVELAPTRSSSWAAGGLVESEAHRPILHGARGARPRVTPPGHGRVRPATCVDRPGDPRATFWIP